MFSLNAQQLLAVRTVDKPSLVIAGAGSGKTRVITEKIAYLIRECALHPRHLVAVTFTNKAAAEMQERVRLLLNRQESKGLTICTFHSLGLKILKTHHDHFGLTQSFSILDAHDAKVLLQQVIQKEYHCHLDTVDQIQHTISAWKNDLLDPDKAHKLAKDNHGLVSAGVYTLYERYLRAYNAIDFDDLISLPVRLFDESPDTLNRWQRTTRHLLVDEYQDTNGAQYRLVQQLVGERESFTLVGDDDQSIYAWRGAKVENLLRLQQDYPLLEVIKLEQNYRSCERILHAANTLIANNSHLFDKALWSELGLGEKIRILPTRSEHDEVERVVKDLLRHKAGTENDYADYALLYRGNHQSRLFEQALREQHIPYRVAGQTSFFSHAEIKDIMAYARILCNPEDDAAFLRVVNCPRREIGPATLEKLSHYARERELSLLQACQEVGLSEALSERAFKKCQAFARLIVEAAPKVSQARDLSAFNELIEQIHYEDWLYGQYNNNKSVEVRLKRLQELKDWIGHIFKKDPSRQFVDVIRHLSLLDILESQNENQQQEDALQLMTLHAAKGLEFPHVYLVGMEEDLLPHRTSIESGDIEEERRLAYVGITRAKKTLVLSFAKQRKKYGEKVACKPSRFLEELPEEHCHWEGDKMEYSETETAAIADSHLEKLYALLRPAD